MEQATMRTKVTLSGGAHNSSEVNVIINPTFNAMQDYHDGKISACDILDEYLSESQRKRLDRHFCGIKGCRCGGLSRAKIDTTNLDINGRAASFVRKSYNDLTK